MSKFKPRKGEYDFSWFDGVIEKLGKNGIQSILCTPTAVVILGGTFATLMPSGMLLLIELAVSVIAGLIVLCFVMLPIFLPATISLVNRVKKAN